MSKDTSHNYSLERSNYSHYNVSNFSIKGSNYSPVKILIPAIVSHGQTKPTIWLQYQVVTIRK